MTADIGGTHARFAIAEVDDHHVQRLTDQLVLQTADHEGVQAAWEFYARQIDRPLPKEAAIAVAGSVDEEFLRFTNNGWEIRAKDIPKQLGLARHMLINDFGAVAHAVAHLDDGMLMHCCGPDRPLPETGAISILGSGTGLGVAQLLRTPQGHHVIETEGGHRDFAPLDAVEDQILQKMRERYHRVSVERVVSGPGLAAIHAILSDIEGSVATPLSERELWDMALAGKDRLAVAALDRFCLCLGAVAGDLALTQGAKAVVLGGGLGARIAPGLRSSGFYQRFTAKGRFESHMRNIPVRTLNHPQPGLFGAASAFIQKYGL